MSPGAAAGAACVSSRILDVIDRVGGVRTAVLAVGIAVLTGARTFTAITTWAHDLTVRCAPCSGLGRGVAKRVDDPPDRTGHRRGDPRPGPAPVGMAGRTLEGTARSPGG